MRTFLTATLMATSLTACLHAQTPDPIDLPALAQEIDATLQAYHYDPSELTGSEYFAARDAVNRLAETATDQQAFLDGFRAIWSDGPYSHVLLQPGRGSAADTAAFLDTMEVGAGAVNLSWDGDIAILEVTTMMGVDTILAIDQAYDDIRDQNAGGLIIDLRENGGGAFAVKPLIEHVITTPVDAGAFVARAWNAERDQAPTLADAADVEPWQGWSILSFWDHVQTEALTRLRFEPDGAGFEGPVYVLTSARTASAAELAADALKASGRATLIGETTAGEMLSQSLFDMPGGLHFYLPIADYYSFAHGRIEGRGVEPHQSVPAVDAMTRALELARP
jgi:carboxyl-terminal processing protease